MKRFLAVVVAVGLAACGDDDKASGGPASGTLGGQPFTPTNVSAVQVAPTTCTIQSTPVNVSGLILGFGSFDLCSYLAQAGFCGAKASSTLVGAAVMKIGLVQAPTAVGAGTYNVIDLATATPDLSGNITGATGSATRTGATCIPTFAEDANAGGTITVSSTSATSVAGSVNFAFGTGSTFSGSYNATVCPQSVDICQLLLLLAGGSCTTPVCVP